MTAAPVEAGGRTPTDDRFSFEELGHPVLVGIVAVAATGALVARFVVPSPLWLDEALSVNIAKLPLAHLPAALRHDGHPPLYYVLLHVWMGWFGEGDRAVRALSGVISLIALPLGYRAGRRVGGPRLGWTTVLVTALSPFLLRYGSETRMYSLVIVLVLAGYLVVLEALERVTPLRLVGVAVVTCALLWTHYWSMWLIASVGLLLVGRLVLDRRARRPLDRPTLAVTAAVAAGIVGFVPWVPDLLEQAAHTGTPWAMPFRPATLVVASLVEFSGGPYSEPQLLMMLSVLLVALGLFGRGIDAWRIELDLRTRPEARLPAAVLGTTIVVASVAGLATHTGFAPRYASIFFPFFLLLVALGLDHFSGPATRNVALGTFLVLSLVGLVVALRLTRTEAGVVAAAISRAHVASALVVTCPDQLGPSVRRAVPAGIEVTTYPRFDDPHRIDWVDYAERNRHNDPAAFADLLLERAGTRTVFVVMNNGFLTFGQQCTDLVNDLAAKRPLRQLVAASDHYYEPMALYVLPPAP